MADSQQNPSHDLDETRDDLAQASLALNTAYDRLQDLRTSLRNFTAQRDRLVNERARSGPRILSAGAMGPDHSAILLSDSEEESEIDMELLRESLPARLLELTSRWGSQHARLNAARQSASSESRTDNSSSRITSLPEEPRTVYPPSRRRRALPQAGSSRDGGITPPGPTSPARRSLLEAHLRQMRHAASLGESTTTLGRRVAQRAAAAAAAQGSAAEHQSPLAGTMAPSDAILHSTLPLGIESRPSALGLESRAASHLRYSLLPNPPSGVRSSSGSRMSPTIGGTHPRFAEHRPRTARSNSLNAATPGARSTSTAIHHAGTQLDASTQTPLSARLVQLRRTPDAVAPVEDDAASRPNETSEIYDSGSGSYRVRRRFNGQGEEHVFNINWGELIPEGDREDGFSDPSAWMRPPRPPRTRRGRVLSSQEPETDDTAVQEYVPFFAREGRGGSVQRRRGWARLDADGDEIFTEDEATFERTRLDPRLPSARNWGRGVAWASSVDFSHSSVRDATLEQRGVSSLDKPGGNTLHPDNQSRRVLDSMFRPEDASVAYTSPLPVTFPDKAAHERQEYTKEVQVMLDGRIAGR